MCQGCIELSRDANYPFVAQVFQRKIHQVEVDAFQQHPGGRDYLAALFRAVAETGDRIVRREAIELVYRLYSAYFRE